jgi:hypothetical protein
MKPNLFDIATKELSQDAFFTWLFLWGNPDCEIYNNELHKCSQEFIKKLLLKQFKINISITKIEAGRQWNNIDIWVKINNEYLIVIEDKISTFEHSNQLENYKKFASDWCAKNNFKLLLFYLKTGTEFSGFLDKISQKNYFIIDRTELIDFFKTYSNIKNDIFQDYYNRLIIIDDLEKTYESLIIKDWSFNSWIGFYKYLESHIDVSGWKYVPNPSGGFIGFWWHFLNWKDCKVYLQIEQGNLCFKIEASKNRAMIRNEFFSIIMKNAKLKNFIEIKKPKRFGNGIWMTVAIVDRNNWLGSDNYLINKNTVISNLKKYEIFLDDCIKN